MKTKSSSQIEVVKSECLHIWICTGVNLTTQSWMCNRYGIAKGESNENI